MANEEASAGRLWASFNSKGEVRDTESSEVESLPGQTLAAALCVKVRERKDYYYYYIIMRKVRGGIIIIINCIYYFFFVCLFVCLFSKIAQSSSWREENM